MAGGGSGAVRVKEGFGMKTTVSLGRHGLIPIVVGLLCMMMIFGSGALAAAGVTDGDFEPDLTGRAVSDAAATLTSTLAGALGGAAAFLGSVVQEPTVAACTTGPLNQYREYIDVAIIKGLPNTPYDFYVQPTSVVVAAVFGGGLPTSPAFTLTASGGTLATIACVPLQSAGANPRPLGIRVRVASRLPAVIVSADNPSGFDCDAATRGGRNVYAG